MRKLLFSILMIGLITSISANLKQETFVDQKKLPPQNQQMIYATGSKNQYISSTSFNYSTIGGSIATILPLFDIGLGHREKYNDFAMDTALRLSTLVIVSSLAGELKFLKYFDNTYVGGGFSAGATFITIVPAALQTNPFITIGKENKNNFHEIDLSLIGISTAGLYIVPTIRYSYGMKF